MSEPTDYLSRPDVQPHLYVMDALRRWGIASALVNAMDSIPRMAALRLDTLSPISSIAAGGGPMNATPISVMARAKSASLPV